MYHRYIYVPKSQYDNFAHTMQYSELYNCKSGFLFLFFVATIPKLLVPNSYIRIFIVAND